MLDEIDLIPQTKFLLLNSDKLIFILINRFCLSDLAWQLGPGDFQLLLRPDIFLLGLCLDFIVPLINHFVAFSVV